MNLKIYLIIFGIILFVAGSYFFYQEFNSISDVSNLDIGGITATSSIEITDNKNLEGEQNIQIADDVEYYKKTADELLKRPVLVSVQMTSVIRTSIEKQIDDLYKSLGENFDQLDGWIGLGQLRKVIGDYQGAREAWEFASVIRPKNSLSFHNLGFLFYYHIKDYPRADFNYLKAIENDSGNIAAYIDLAEMYSTVYTQKLNAIPALLNGGLDKNASKEDRIPLLARLAKHYTDIKEYAKALELYEQILALQPTADQIEVVNRAIEWLRAQ